MHVFICLIVIVHRYNAKEFFAMTSFFELSLLIFIVTRICLRTQDWPANVAHAKNNFICVPIVKRDKRMRVVERPAGRYPAAEHPNA
jgi:hypothetical protein